MRMYLASIQGHIRGNFTQHLQLLILSPNSWRSTKYQAVLDSGFLDVLLCMYVSGFSSEDPWFVSLQQLIGPNHTGILEACTAALEMLCEAVDAIAVVSAHPIHTLWPKNQVLLIQFGLRMKERYLQWRGMDIVVVARRLVAAQPELEQLSLSTGRSNLSRLMDLCIDIVEFSRQVIFLNLLVGKKANLDSGKACMAQILHRTPSR